MNYAIDFTITNGSSTLSSFTKQLSHNDGAGNLLVGAYNATAANYRTKTPAAGDVLQRVEVTAAWHVGQIGGDGPTYAAPNNATEPDAVAYLKAHPMKGAVLHAAGNVKISDKYDAVAGITDYTDVYLKLSFSGDNAGTITVTYWAADTCTGTQLTALGARIETNNPTGAEWYDATDKGEEDSVFGQTADSHMTDGAVYHHTDALGIAAVASLTAM